MQLGLACCGMEASAANLERAVEQANLSTELSILVLAGTVTHALVPSIRAAYEQLPEPRRVVAFGVCTISGGPYWDSYSVVPGAHEVVPVDVHVPGCPPSPTDLEAAITSLAALAP